MPYDKPKPYEAPETSISTVDNTSTTPTVNLQKRQMKTAGRVGGANPRMMPKNSKPNAQFM